MSEFHPSGRMPNEADMNTAAVFIATLLVFVAVAAVLFIGTSLLIPSLLANPLFNIAGKPELPASIAKPSTKIDLASLTPTPTPAPTPTPQPQYVRVVNTGGDGVFLRRTPRSSDRLVAWMDGTVLQIVGEDREAEGMIWRHVKDPKGNIGWVPAKYLSEPFQ